MDPTPRRPASAHDFSLGEWLVQPSRNRLSRPGDEVQLEPKMMDVLVLLAERGGEVVAKSEINDAVWSDVIVSESVVTRAIAGLRRALEDDVRRPRFIETIAKRGYRLVARPVSLTPPAWEASPAVRDPRVTPPALPYAVGRWVRGEAFYGRAAQLAEILQGRRSALWLLGARQVGKTSLLRHLELLTATAPEQGWTPLYWDLQGVAEPGELHASFADALEDAEPTLRRVGVELDQLRDDSLFAAVGRLRRELSARGRRLLLLCDETEELIQLGRREPPLLGKLRRTLQGHEAVRSVLASSSRLWVLAETDGDTSPFLHGFVPPLYLGALESEESRRLVRQAHLPEGERPHLTDREVEELRSRCGDHPCLLQLVGARAHRLGDLGRALAEVAGDPTVQHLFAVDHELLGEGERSVVGVLAAGPAVAGQLAGTVPAVAASLRHLVELGLVRDLADGRFELANGLFRDWLLSTRQPEAEEEG